MRRHRNSCKVHSSLTQLILIALGPGTVILGLIGFIITCIIGYITISSSWRTFLIINRLFNWYINIIDGLLELTINISNIIGTIIQQGWFILQYTYFNDTSHYELKYKQTIPWYYNDIWTIICLLSGTILALIIGLILQYYISYYLFTIDNIIHGKSTSHKRRRHRH